jgi:dUTPase
MKNQKVRVVLVVMLVSLFCVGLRPQVAASQSADSIARSSLPRKKGLICPHGLGVIDEDYHGPNDEILVQVENITDQPVTVEKGERIAQGLFVKVEKADWQEVDDHGAESRGGFGSTGTHA